MFIPKYRRKTLYKEIKSEPGCFFRELAKHKESPIIEEHICIDHIRMCISIPPKCAVSNVVGHIKGKNAIMTARNLMGVKRMYLCYDMLNGK